jgi:hypothetical protein
VRLRRFNKPISIERDSVRKGQLLEPLSLVEGSLKRQNVSRF